MPQLLKDAIRDVPDFPKPGILFKDITPVLSDPTLFQLSIDKMLETVENLEIDKVVAIDARGFLFGPSVALKKNAGFIPVRKQGKLPWKTNSIAYSLEYGENVLEIHQDAITPGDRVMIIDDLLATGGTAAATVTLLKQLGAEVTCVTFLIELDFLNGRQTIDCDNIHSILNY
ncbi:adenine phosphoribosyltransferase [Rubritalea sp.]|uniref:adenine phosphoribosyltransferase n=1 Tax=Rubritalea sp. TaxID=2109375 RepID=UPI003EF74F5E